ncbi:MAG: haloacid dehalogenase type II [Actinomycetota bacterium]|nr:haloacid dehalogenase type II [Actinomycetota bacterium]
MSARPRVIVFDMIGTVFSLEPVRRALADRGLPPLALELWFARLLRDAFATTAAGGFITFADAARGALATVCQLFEIEEVDASSVLDAFGRLPAYPDARPAMQRCREEELEVVALTNGARETTERLLAQEDLAGLVDDVVSAQDLGVWKPSAAVYEAALAGRDVEPAEAALVAVHGWDVYGARRAGLMTGWCSRLEGTLSSALGPVDVQGEDLLSVVHGLLAR